jgi:gamma-D-glutamyl-L-lysine dipeptidyl-peptidase
MIFAVCPLSVIPLRAHPSQRSEMLSQVLFGELVEVMEEKGRAWAKVRCVWDDTVGWAASNQLLEITHSEYDAYREQFAISLELLQPASAADHFLPLTLGAQLPLFDGIRFQLGEREFSFSGQVIFPHSIHCTRELVVKLARRYMHAPFLWGGRSPMGIDGAGLVQMAFKLAGTRLPRTAEKQIFEGDIVDFIEQARPGDIAFFENNLGRVFHAGIILPDSRILHAFGKVRTDLLDHYGIFDEEKRKYSHRLRVIKSILPPGAETTAPPQEKAEPAQTQIALF